MKIYIDEAGNTGDDLTREEQPFFVLAAVMVDDEQLSQILPVAQQQFASHKEKEETEIKAKSWSKAAKKAPALQVIEEKILECHGDIAIVIVEKRFMVAAMIVEYFFDHYYNDKPDPKWVNNKREKIKAVNYFYDKLDDRLTVKLWAAFRNPEQAAFEEIIVELLQINDNSEFKELLTGAIPHLPKIVNVLSRDNPHGTVLDEVSPGTMRSANFSAFHALINMLIPRCIMKEQTAEIVFDSVPQFNVAYKRLFDIFTNMKVRGYVFDPDELPVYSWRGITTQFITADSRQEPGLQLADVIASSVNSLMLKVHKGDLSKFIEFDLFNILILKLLADCNKTIHYVVSGNFYKHYLQTVCELGPKIEEIKSRTPRK